mgnify:CR=1 FL=1
MEGVLATISLILTVIILGLLVFIHEFGHFLAAKLNGVYVEEFAFGFGKKIWSKKIKGTVYRINLIPLGGYVMMLGDADPSSFLQKAGLASDNRSLQSKTYLQKVSIVLAGIFVNFLLAIIIFYLFLSSVNFKPDPIVNFIDYKFVGADQEELLFYYDLDKGGAAILANIPEIGFIYEVNGEKTGSLEALQEVLNNNEEKKVNVKIVNLDYKVMEFLVQLPKKSYDGNVYLGVYPFSSMLNSFHFDECVVYNGLIENSSAESAKLPVIGAVTKVENENIVTNDDLKSVLNKFENKAVKVEVMNANQQKKIYDVQLGKKDEEDGKVLLGLKIFTPQDFPYKFYMIDYTNYSFFAGVSHTINITAYQFVTMMELVSRALAGKPALLIDSLATPIKVGELVYTEVSIVKSTSQSFSEALSSLFLRLVNLTGLLSAGFAFMNLFPIPLIDGGQLLFITIEKIRGKPLSIKAQNIIGKVSFGCLVLVAVVFLLKDFMQVILDRIF